MKFGIEDDERFMALVEPEPNTGCWLWFGHTYWDGYGQVGRRGKKYRAHRLAYEKSIGPLGDLVIHHTCHQTLCVNPEHLQPMTVKDHMLLEGNYIIATKARVAKRRAKTHCKHGHLFDVANTYWAPTGRRKCRACDRIRHQGKYQCKRERAEKFLWRKTR